VHYLTRNQKKNISFILHKLPWHQTVPLTKAHAKEKCSQQISMTDRLKQVIEKHVIELQAKIFITGFTS